MPVFHTKTIESILEPVAFQVSGGRQQIFLFLPLGLLLLPFLFIDD